MRELRRIGRTRAVAIGLAAVLLGFASVLALRSGGGHDRARQAGRPVDLSTRATSSPRTDTTTSAPTSRRPALSLPRLIGQRIMVGFPGVTPTKSLLDRVRAGTVGAV